MGIGIVFFFFFFLRGGNVLELDRGDRGITLPY